MGRAFAAAASLFAVAAAALLAWVHLQPPPHAPPLATDAPPMATATAAATAAVARAAPSSALIFLHGLGDEGASWAWLARQFARPGLRASFPDAPHTPVTLNNGRPMPAWFDLDDLPVTPRTPFDAPGFAASTAAVHALIDAEVARGVAANRIVLGGFSQGAALAAYAGLRYASPLGGLVLLSGWLAGGADDLPSAMPPAVAAAASAGQLRAFVGHGTRDDKVLFELGGGLRDALVGAGVRVEWAEFRGGHTLADVEVEGMSKLLDDVLGAA